jgi:hypothetical protein
LSEDLACNDVSGRRMHFGFRLDSHLMMPGSGHHFSLETCAALPTPVVRLGPVYDNIGPGVLVFAFTARPTKSLMCTTVTVTYPSLSINIASSDIRRSKVCGRRRHLTNMFELRSSPVLVRFCQVFISFQYIALFRYRGLGVLLAGLDASDI